MDNPLTPKKIQRLMNLAEDKSFSFNRRLLTNEDESRNTRSQSTFNQTSTNCESSGIIDLERVDGFGESGLGSISSKSNTFSPAEMTGRSTEAVDRDGPNVATSKAFDEYGRHSMTLDNITSHMDKQTSEIQDLMRHSIATNYSFHTKRDLTADEESLVLREAPLPVQHSTQVNFQDSTMLTGSNVSAYFKNRCPEFKQILGKTDSPDRPSISEISAYSLLQHAQNNTYKMDQTLDCVPVRQPRIDKTLEKPIAANLYPKVDVPHTVPKTNADMTSNYMNKTTQSMSSSSMGVKAINQNTIQKSFMCSSKPTDILLRNLQTSLHMVPDDTECSVENSLSISRIADYLGKESNVSISDMLKLNNQMKQLNKKQPLTEVHLNILENKDVNKELYVTNLKDTKNAETAASSSTINTIIPLDKLKINEKPVPTLVFSQYELDNQNCDVDELRSVRPAQSNSPSGKSHTTLSTVQENIASFKSGGDSPLRDSKGEACTSRISSPNSKYRELDKSVDWDEMFKQKRFSQEGFAKERWAEITTSPVEGFVGVSVPVTISVTTLTDNWLTAKFEFDNLPNDSKNMTIESPRFPVLLSPAKTEKITLYLTSNIEMSRCLPYTMHLKDASLDCDVEYKGSVEVNIKMPVIQALSCDGVNKLNFPTIQERSSVTRHFVLLSDCPVDLQLELSIPTGENMFVIKSVQEIRKTDVSKVLMDRSRPMEDGQVKIKKVINKQLCRLSNGNAIKVAVTFCSPILSDMELSDHMPTFNGILNINLIGINTVMKKINLIGSVGSASLVVQPPVEKLLLTNEPTVLTLRNAGTITGVWAVKFKSKTATDGQFPFKVSANRIEISPGSVNQLKLVYFGPADTLNDGTLILEDTANGSVTSIEITGGLDKPKSFPIKTNYNNMTWVRAGRKELSLKNSTNQKIHIRCQMLGEGFMLDCPGAESRGTYILAFGPCECRPLPIVFAPKSCLPHAAALHLVYDKNSDYSRKIKLHGCASNDSVRWSGLMTYGDTALVRAASRSDVRLQLFNRAATPAFLYARVQFNLQYRFISSESELVGGRHVIGRRSPHTVSLRVPWPKLERRARASDATALATVTILTGPEFTRRRIIRILKNEPNRVMDLTLLPDHLKILVEPFEGEDETMDTYLEDFNETKASLNELIEGLQELTAQIDLPHDFAEDNTILITDDTVVVHHTLCD